MLPPELPLLLLPLLLLDEGAGVYVLTGASDDLDGCVYVLLLVVL
jgi:hypothetical protein